MGMGAEPRAVGLPRALAVLALALWAAGASPADEVADGIAAQVGTEIVLVSEVMQMVGPMEAQLREAGAPREEIARLRAEGLERMIEWRLIEEVVRKTELYASDEQVDSAIEAIAGDNQMSVAELEENVTAHGMSFSDYRAEIKREIERSKVLAAMVSSKIVLDEAEVRRLYDERFADQPDGGEQVHLRQILLTFGGDTERGRDGACGDVAAARRQVLAGTPFQEMASRDNAMAPARGGDIGWLHVSSLAPWMVRVVGELEPGDTSEVVELPFGCTILQLVDRREYTRVTYEMAKPRLERELIGIREAEEYRAWMEELRENTFIQRHGHFAEAGVFLDRRGPDSVELN